MRFSIIDTEDGRWTSFLARFDHDVYHKPGYVRHLGRERGMRPCACYGISETSEFLLPLLLTPIPPSLDVHSEGFDALAPDGYPGPLFSGTESELALGVKRLMPFLRENGIVTCFVRSNPVLDVALDPFRGVGEVVERGSTIPIYLDAPYEEILSEMRKGHRHEIRKMSARGFRVSVDEWDYLPTFVAFYRNLMDAVGAAPPYRFTDAYFDGFRDAANGSAHLAVALSGEGTPAAAALFTHCCGIIQYHLAATSEGFEREPVQKLVVDALIRFGIENEARVVHLGGGVGAEDDSLLHFKAGFGQTKLTYHTMHLIPDPEGESAARSAWMRLHGARPPQPGFFPPHRSPAPAIS